MYGVIHTDKHLDMLNTYHNELSIYLSTYPLGCFRVALVKIVAVTLSFEHVQIEVTKKLMHCSWTGYYDGEAELSKKGLLI